MKTYPFRCRLCSRGVDYGSLLCPHCGSAVLPVLPMLPRSDGRAVAVLRGWLRAALGGLDALMLWLGVWR